jgi:hypothetical protein
MIDNIARWILVKIILEETAVTRGNLTNTFQINQMTIIATYDHAQDSLATTKIKQICFLFFLKRILC